MMNSRALGGSTSQVEVTNISSRGIWLLSHDKEFFLPYEDFPWFRDQTVRVLLNVEEPRRGHFHWPDIDVDLTEEIIDHPERFPLTAKREL